MFTPIVALHIPDGFLSIPVSAIGWALSVVLIAVALRRTQGQLGERQIPLMGILAAFIFAAQMINFPVAGGTSGHLIGGVLAAILLGPWAAVLVLTSVVAIQALIFQDGGLLVLGVNVVNMAAVSAFIGYGVYVLGRRTLGDGRLQQIISIAAAAWLSVVVSAAACAVELALSGTVALPVVLPAMVGVHILIGIGEALITVAAWSFIRQTRPDLLVSTDTPAARGHGWIAAGLLIALAVTLASPLASPHPDGLERVAEDTGFLETAQDAPYQIIPDYQVPLLEDEALSTIAAGIIGVLLVGGIAFGMARLGKNESPEA